MPSMSQRINNYHTITTTLRLIEYLIDDLMNLRFHRMRKQLIITRYRYQGLEEYLSVRLLVMSESPARQRHFLYRLTDLYINLEILVILLLLLHLSYI